MQAGTAQKKQTLTAEQLHQHALHLEAGRRLDEAVACQLKAVTAAPKIPIMHLELGLFLLRRGEFGPGLIEYEWRWQLPDRVNAFPKFRVPQWNGMNLKSGRLLLVGDQGAGDKIQFARYIPLVAERCGDVVMACPPDTKSLFEGMGGISKIATQWNGLPPFDVYSTLSSLPFAFGTTLETIPNKVPYLAADPGKIAAWKERLDARLPAGPLRVGIVWAGSPNHANDQKRSMRLAQWQELLALPGVSFVSLQKVVPEADRATLAAHDIILDVSSNLTDFSETAALIENLDLVISVDTSVIHLAGALGKPAWVLLAWVPDWRWMLEREDSPWYPSLRLLRQTVPDDWSGPIARAAQELKTAAAGDAGRLAPFLHGTQ